MSELNSARFWVVWNPTGCSPTRQHWSRDDADAEARRLAAKCPDQSFVVLKAVGAFVCKVSAPEPFRFYSSPKTPSDRDPIPF